MKMLLFLTIVSVVVLLSTHVCMNENMRVCVRSCNKFEITLHHITDW